MDNYQQQGLLSPEQEMPSAGGGGEGLLAQDARVAAARRMQEAQRPMGGRQEGMMLPAALTAYASALGLAPEALMLRLMQAAPGATGAALGATAMPTGANAGEDDFKWDDPNADRLGEMKDIQKRLNERAAKITELGATKTKSPAGTQALTIASLEKMNGTDTGRLEKLREQQDSDRGEALKLWQQKTQSEKPFRQNNPEIYRALPVAGWLASAAAGLAGSKGGAPIKSMLGGAAGGTLASTAAAIAPTAYDSATLPTGSKYQDQAYQWLRDPEYYKGRVVPEVAVGMLLGALGGKWGSLRGSSQKTMPTPQSPARTPPPAMGLLSPEATAQTSATSPIVNNKTLKELMDLAGMDAPIKKGKR